MITLKRYWGWFWPVSEAGMLSAQFGFLVLEIADPRYEVFNPIDGKPIFTTRLRWLAKLVAWWKKLDFAEQGEGWI